MAVGNGEVAWQPSRVLVQFEHDLQFLPVLFASSNDLLICTKQPSSDFLASIKWVQGSSCSFNTLDQVHKLAEANSLLINKLEPWGWSPAIHHRLRKLKTSTSENYKSSPMYDWKPEFKNLYSRANALSVLQKILHVGNRTNQLLPNSFIPEVVYTVDEVEQLMVRWHQLVLKSPWSASGRGVQILRFSYLNTSNRQWISSVLKHQGYLMVEPLLNKKLDFSLHFHISSQGIHPLGISTFRTNSNGQYLTSDIFPNYKTIESLISVSDLQQMLQNAILESGAQNLYEGYIGVDLMVVEIDGRLVIHPCVEINWRYNMGLVALRLRQILPNVEKGFFSIFISPTESFGAFCERMKAQYPSTFVGGFPFKGFFPLSDFTDVMSGAYILLGENM